eukprot:5833426-Karenia_brevis.AAC.1
MLECQLENLKAASTRAQVRTLKSRKFVDGIASGADLKRSKVEIAKPSGSVLTMPVRTRRQRMVLESGDTDFSRREAEREERD